MRLQIEGCDLSLQRCGVRIAEGLLPTNQHADMPTSLVKRAIKGGEASDCVVYVAHTIVSFISFH